MRYFLLLFCLLLTACAPPTVTPTSAPTPTAIAVTQPATRNTPTSTPTPPASLTVCLTHEPPSLYLYDKPDATRDFILTALYGTDYATQEVRVENAVVNFGDPIADALGRAVTLTEGTPLWGQDATLIHYQSGAVTLPQHIITYHLRPDLVWPDGTPVTAEDVQTSLALQNETATTLDAHTLEWRGLPGARQTPALWILLPPSYRAADISIAPEALDAPPSFGPYRVAQWEKGVALTLLRNPQAGNVPAQIIFRFVSDLPTLRGLWQTGACDFAPNLTDPVLFAAMPQLQPTPSDALVFLHFNHAVFSDVRIRRALALCMERDALPADSLFGAVDTVFDPVQGRTLLTSPLSLTLAYAPALETLAQELQTQLTTNCGVTLSLRALTTGELHNDYPDGFIFGRHYELALFVWHAPTCELWLSEQIANDTNPAGANNTGYSNADFDVACRRILLNLAPATDAQQLFARDLPALPLQFEPRYQLVNPALQAMIKAIWKK